MHQCLCLFLLRLATFVVCFPIAFANGQVIIHEKSTSNDLLISRYL